MGKERVSNGDVPNHPELQQALDILLRSREFVHSNPEDGREIMDEVHAHLEKCDPRRRLAQENIKFY